MIAAVALIGLLFIVALMASAFAATGVALEAAGDHELPALDPAASTTRGVLLELRGRRARR
ncbi:MAG: hypothetical protein IPH07_08075 [Deltaproteobacteria bacterium]|nr:hypothetical protein [Deltaproteobacteria bacterium]MBK8236698.1 hypothetical protein [Deltaproteobacteria bacterium]MBK8719989.1 hypothetical protein [Deltaproteobacteria bacterium]MBP7288727.1 hypothetical protein [Nannocystaceae bacterium]